MSDEMKMPISEREAEQSGWQTRYDGTSFCPTHQFQKGHQK
jgi:hypothetical protein